jgi:DNA (cytosine-5)-methyltransferase 1
MPMNVLCFNRKKTVRTNYNDKSIEEVRQENMRFLDLFAGIGGFRLGMQQAGHECVGYVEWDKYARKSYEAIHQTEGEWTANDIRSVTDNDLGLLRGKGIDIICGGFPCQAFSVAGKRGGFDDTRGTLFFEIARFAQQIKPRFLFLENVKGLLSHDQGNTFGTILNTLDELGYDTEWQVLNSKDFGVPQNRERVFIIGHLRGTSRREVFPFGGENENTIQQIGNIDQHKRKRINPQTGRVYSTDGVAPCLSTMQGGGLEPKIVMPVLTPDREEKRQQGRRFKEPGEPAFTVNTIDRHGVAIMEPKLVGGIGEMNFGSQYRQGNRVYDSNAIAMCLNAQPVGNTGGNSYLYEIESRIRKLTPRECWRLQGFPDWAFDKAKEVNSDSQLYKQAGNSVSVPVIYEIAKRLGVE